MCPHDAVEKALGLFYFRLFFFFFLIDLMSYPLRVCFLYLLVQLRELVWAFIVLLVDL